MSHSDRERQSLSCRWLLVVLLLGAGCSAYALAQDGAGGFPPPEDLGGGVIDGFQWFLTIMGVEQEGLILGVNHYAGGFIAELLSSVNQVAFIFSALLTMWGFGRTMSVDTARAGKVGGGQGYSVVWTSIRSFASLALLVPIPTFGGYSIIQMIVFAVVAMGSNFADITWKGVTRFMSDHGAIVQPLRLERSNSETTLGSDSLAFSAFIAYSCMEEVKRTEAMVGFRISDWEKGKNGSLVLTFDQVPSEESAFSNFSWFTGKDTGRGTCGTFTIPGPPSEDLFYEGSIEAVTLRELQDFWRGEVDQMANLVQAAARKHWDTDEEERPALEEFLHGELSGLQVEAGARQKREVARLLALRGDSAEASMVAKALGEVEEAGWFFAGAYYLTIQRINSDLMDAANMRPIFRLPHLKHLPADTQLYTAAVIKSATRKLQTLPGNEYADLETEPTGWWDKLMSGARSIMNGITGKIIDAATFSVAGGGNPVANLQQIGYYMLDIAGAVLALSFFKDAAEGLLTGAAAASAAVNPGLAIAFAAVKSVVSSVGAFLVPFGLILGLFAIMLCYWFPAIPFVTWFSSIMGWVFWVVEALVSAPLWVAAHASLSKDEGLSSNLTFKGYMLLLALGMYPLLAVIGLVLAMVVVYFGSAFLLITFSVFYKGLHIGTTMGLISTLVMMGFFVSLLLANAQKAYRLCYQLPRYALEWIGGSPTQLGEEGDQERMTAAFFLAFQRQLRPSPTGRATSTAKNALAKVADERSGSGNDAGEFADKIG